jgi:hypothetical protein
VRLQQACDLYLDTPLYNSHSTAADVLWAGIPLLTQPLHAPASRMAASVVAASVPAPAARALILPTAAPPGLAAACVYTEYVRRAVALLQDAERLQTLRHMVEQHRCGRDCCCGCVRLTACRPGIVHRSLRQTCGCRGTGGHCICCGTAPQPAARRTMWLSRSDDGLEKLRVKIFQSECLETNFVGCFCFDTKIRIAIKRPSAT